MQINRTHNIRQSVVTHFPSAMFGSSFIFMTNKATNEEAICF
jgi:hypothetical protein